MTKQINSIAIAARLFLPFGQDHPEIIVVSAAHRSLRSSLGARGRIERKNFEDLRDLFAHSFAGHADAGFHTFRKPRHVLMPSGGEGTVRALIAVQQGPSSYLVC